MRLRIVHNNSWYSIPYQLQSWRWWWPFWRYESIHYTIESAEVKANKLRNPVVKVLP